MKLWGKELNRDDAIAEISKLRNEIFQIEHSGKYSEYSDAGNDALWYQIEAKLDEIEMLKAEYNIP